MSWRLRKLRRRSTENPPILIKITAREHTRKQRPVPESDGQPLRAPSARASIGQSVRSLSDRQSVRDPSVRASVGHLAAMTLVLINLYTSVGYTRLVYPAPHGPVNSTEHYKKHIPCGSQRYCSCTFRANDNACDNMKYINRRATPTSRVIQTGV